MIVSPRYMAKTSESITTASDGADDLPSYGRSAPYSKPSNEEMHLSYSLLIVMSVFVLTFEQT